MLTALGTLMLVAGCGSSDNENGDPAGEGGSGQDALNPSFFGPAQAPFTPNDSYAFRNFCLSQGGTFSSSGTACLTQYSASINYTDGNFSRIYPVGTSYGGDTLTLTRLDLNDTWVRRCTFWFNSSCSGGGSKHYPTELVFSDAYGSYRFPTNGTVPSAPQQLRSPSAATLTVTFDSATSQMSDANLISMDFDVRISHCWSQSGATLDPNSCN